MEVYVIESTSDQLLTEKQLRQMVGNVSSMSIWRWLAAGLLPRPLKIQRRNYWKLAEIRAWLDAQPRRPVAEKTNAA